MDHFLITRFNLKVKDWTHTRDGHSVDQQEWLSHRFELFEQYCLPSVKNQTNQEFKWLVFFDTDTPKIYKEKNEQIAESYPTFIPIYLSGIEQFNKEIGNIIFNHSASEYIITSRLDNDDLLHKDFIQTIKENSRYSDELIIDFERGYQLIDKTKGFEIRNYIHFLNPFISLVERRGNLQTVMARNHRDWFNAKELIKISDKAMWVENVHAKNKLNGARLNITLSTKKDLKDFGLTNELELPNLSHVLMTNLRIKFKRLSIKLKRLLVNS